MDQQIIATYSDGHVVNYSSIEEASRSCGLKPGQIKSRLNQGTGKKSKDGITFKWADPSVIRKKLGKKNKKKGNAFELQVIKKLHEAGYPECVSSRSQNKKLDADKVDIYDESGQLPFHIQCKCTTNTPNYFKIKEECQRRDKPFALAWKKCVQGEHSPGTVVMIDLENFLPLIKPINLDTNNEKINQLT